MMPKERDGRALTARYEDLRRWAVAPAGALPQPRGLALLVQQGVPAWMRAWLAAAPPRPAASAVAPPSPPPGVGPLLVVLLSTTRALKSRWCPVEEADLLKKNGRLARVVSVEAYPPLIPTRTC